MGQIDPGRTCLGTEAGDDIGDVDRDHGAGSAQIRHDLLGCTNGHLDLAESLFTIVPPKATDGEKIVSGRIGIYVAHRGSPLVKE